MRGQARALVIGLSYAADKIVLSCSGWVALKSPGTVADVSNLSIVIDQDQRVVTGALGEFPLVQSSATLFGFKGPSKSGGETTGSFDRITGSAGVSTWEGNDYTFYGLNCKPAKPLF
jgi:hypothetical protein